MTKENVTLTLTKDEAVILFEFTSRFTDTDKLSVEHQSEERILWNLCSHLEKELSEPSKSNYNELLKQAQENLKDDA